MAIMPQKKNPSPYILESVIAISKYLGKSPRTIQYWIKAGYLPAMKNPRGHWFTTVSLIDQWVMAGHKEELSLYERRKSAKQRAAGG